MLGHVYCAGLAAAALVLMVIPAAGQDPDSGSICSPMPPEGAPDSPVSQRLQQTFVTSPIRDSSHSFTTAHLTPSAPREYIVLPGGSGI